MTVNRQPEPAVAGGTLHQEHEKSLSKHVLKNSFFILLARGIQLLSAFVVAIVVARHLSITQYGEYSFLVAYVSSIMALAYFGIQQTLIREIAKGGVSAGEVLGAAVRLRTSLSLIAATIIVASLFFMKLPRMLVEAGLIAVASEFCLSFSMLSKAMFQAFEKMVYEPLVSVLYSAALLAGVATVMIFKGGFLWLFFALAMANFVQLTAASVIISKRFIRPVFTLERGLYKRFFKDSLVIGVGIFFYQNLFKINVLMLRWVGSVNDVSFFSAPHNLIMQLQVVPLSLTTAIFPVFSRLISTDRERMIATFEKIFRVMFLASAFAAVMLSLYSREIILLVFSNKFEQSVAALAIMSWAVIPLTLDMLLNGVLIAMNKQKYSVIYAGVTIAVNVLASLLLIPRYGFIAASYIAVLSYTLLFLCSWYITARNGVKIAMTRTVVNTIVATGMAAAAIMIVKPYSIIAALFAGTGAFCLAVMATGAITVQELMLMRESLRTPRRTNLT